MKTKGKKPANGYKMPDPLPHGEILIDVARKEWRLGESIGKGGFGEVYLAQDASKSSSKYPYVIKVEPHGNGPLFVEMHFYMKNAKAADIENFMKKHKLKTFGMPVYLGSGSHECRGKKYRFIVMDKFGIDIDKLRNDRKGALSVTMVYQLAWQITYVLEYIHEMGYVHADIKGGNVLLGESNDVKNQSFLLDYGIATKFTLDTDFKPNPKKAHDGTIEYLSRDAHCGVPTRRGDFEILGYNLICWLGGSLPWQTELDDQKLVQQLKDEQMNDIPKFVKTYLKKNSDTVIKFLQYVNNLKFNEKPHYKKIRAMFEHEIQKNGSTVNAPFDFSCSKNRTSESEDKEKIIRSEDEAKKSIRKREKNQKENVICNASGEVMNDAMKEVLAMKKAQEAIKKKIILEQLKDEFKGYTEEMKEVKMRMMRREQERPRRHAKPF